MHSRPTLSVSVSAALLGALLLTGCVEEGEDFEGAVAPAASLPPTIAQLVPTDVAQFFVTPRADVDEATVAATIAKIKQEPGVETAELEDGRLNLVLSPGIGADRRGELLRQAAALGEIVEGV